YLALHNVSICVLSQNYSFELELNAHFEIWFGGAMNSFRKSQSATYGFEFGRKRAGYRSDPNTCILDERSPGASGSARVLRLRITCSHARLSIKSGSEYVRPRLLVLSDFVCPQFSGLKRSHSLSHLYMAESLPRTGDIGFVISKVSLGRFP